MSLGLTGDGEDDGCIASLESYHAVRHIAVGGSIPFTPRKLTVNCMCCLRQLVFTREDLLGE